jgi:hypothetical protein
MKTLAEFYEYVEQLLPRLRSTGQSVLGDTVETALRGGATSSEILGNLWFALGRVRDSGIDEPRIGEALAFIERTLGPPRPS